MIQKATVIRTEKNQAIVQVLRVSACGEHCVHCGACAKNTVEICVRNEIGAKSGDMVEVLLSDEKVYFAAFLVYLLPLIFFFFGYFLMGLLFFQEGVRVAFGGVLFALSFLLVARYSKKRKKEYMSEIIKIL